MRLFEALSNWVSERRGRIVIALVLVIWVYFLVAFAEQAWRANQLQADVEEQRHDIERIREENQAIQQELDRLEGEGSETYVASVARRDLGLAEPGQSVAVVRWIGDSEPAPSRQSPEANEEDSRPTWQRWVDLLTGGE